MIFASIRLPLALFSLTVLQFPLDPRSGLSMLFEDLLSFVLGLVVLFVLAYVAYRVWGPIAGYVRHDGE